MDKQRDATGRENAMHRIQVGLVGLVAVLLLVSVTNFVLQRASDEQSPIEQLHAEAENETGAAAVDAKASEKPADPLQELGITPTPKTEDEGLNKLSGAAAAAGQTVPDLKPDPKLEAPMDREAR